ncbi:MAG: hypothetical protein Q4F97_10920 [Bacteroidales bacterium]|nr:hypothetical protein [Bacteroidales bacterium]
MKRLYILFIICTCIQINTFGQDIKENGPISDDSLKVVVDDTTKMVMINNVDTTAVNTGDSLINNNIEIKLSNDSIISSDSLSVISDSLLSDTVIVKTIEERIYEAPLNTSFPITFYQGETSDTARFVRVPSKFLNDFYVFTWKDYNCTLPSDMSQDTTIVLIDRVAPIIGNFSIYIFRIGSGPRFRDIIASISKTGEIIDWIEAGAYYQGDVRINVREWEISRMRIISVTELLVFKPEALLLDQHVQSLVASRRDTQYTISSTGKFRKKAYIKYQDREYDRSYIINKDKYLKDGKEIALPR